MNPGDHVWVIGGPCDALEARRRGFQLRDTVTILLPAGHVLQAFLLRQPLEGTVADTVLTYGSGGLNINGCRITSGKSPTSGLGAAQDEGFFSPHGRWPSNLVIVHGQSCTMTGTKAVKGSHDTTGVWGQAGSEVVYQGGWDRDPKAHRQNFTSSDGTETAPAYTCQPDCPCRLLDGLSGVTRNGGSVYQGHGPGGFSGNIGGLPTHFAGDSGSASRFYPQFENLHAALDWLTLLTGAPS